MCSSCSTGGADKGTPVVSKYPDLTGLQFSRLTVLGPGEKKGFWQCLCTCGSKKDIYGHNLSHGLIKSCGCLRRSLREARKELMCSRLLGQQFNDLTVLEYAGHSSFKCRCICGNEIVIPGSALLAGLYKSCGCLRTRYRKSLVGQRFGRLTVVEYAGIRSKRASWLCKCDCGNEKVVLEHNLKAGRTVSCGCYQREPRPNPRGGLKLDLVGMRFGRLTVLGRASPPSSWICRCDCGKEVVAPSPRLRRGEKTHCGCQRKARSRPGAETMKKADESDFHAQVF